MGVYAVPERKNRNVIVFKIINNLNIKLIFSCSLNNLSITANNNAVTNGEAPQPNRPYNCELLNPVL
jgi:hypothetical protein